MSKPLEKDYKTGHTTQPLLARPRHVSEVHVSEVQGGGIYAGLGNVSKWRDRLTTGNLDVPTSRAGRWLTQSAAIVLSPKSIGVLDCSSQLSVLYPPETHFGGFRTIIWRIF